MVDASARSGLPRATGRAAARLELSDQARAGMRAHVEATYPEEACGGLLGLVEADGAVSVAQATPLANMRTDERHRRYLVGPDDVLSLERRAGEAGLRVVGYYHSHPEAPAVPSAFDREHAWPWYVYLIVSVRGGRAEDAQAWRLSDDRERFDRLAFQWQPGEDQGEVS